MKKLLIYSVLSIAACSIQAMDKEVMDLEQALMKPELYDGIKRCIRNKDVQGFQHFIELACKDNPQCLRDVINRSPDAQTSSLVNLVTSARADTNKGFLSALLLQVGPALTWIAPVIMSKLTDSASGQALTGVLGTTTAGIVIKALKDGYDHWQDSSHAEMEQLLNAKLTELEQKLSAKAGK